MTVGYWIGILATFVFTGIICAWMFTPDPMLGQIARWLKLSTFVPVIVGAIGGAFTLFGAVTCDRKPVDPIFWIALAFNAWAVFVPLGMMLFN